MVEKSSEPRLGQWMSIVLRCAAIYNCIFGLITLVTPHFLFDIFGATRPNYPELWQCIGMIVGVYGIGYWIASYNPMRHWPIVLVGFLGKIFGPIGFLKSLYFGVFPIQFGLIIIFNDIIWWVPFYWIIKKAFIQETMPELPKLLDSDTQKFEKIIENSNQSDVVLYFLRHAGCTFCREGLSDLKQNETIFNNKKLFIIHMAQDNNDSSDIGILIKKLNFKINIELIADPDRRLYRIAGIQRAKFKQVFSLRTIYKGFIAGIINRHGVGKLEGDGFMMSGLFFYRKKRLIYSWLPVDVSESPPFLDLKNL